MKVIKLTVVCLVFLLLISVFGVASLAEEESSWASFTQDVTYKANSPLSLIPSTFEVTLRYPSELSDRGGVIFGNYSSSGSGIVNYEIYSDGMPRLYIVDNNAKVYNIVFENVSLKGLDEWVHLAIVKNSKEGTVSCYINGVLKETVSAETPSWVNFTSSHLIGGDRRDGNTQYFKGEIKSLALYGDVRTDEEILSDSVGGYDDEGLLGYYVLSSGKDKFEDIGGVGPSFTAYSPFIYDYRGCEDYAYSFAVLGDTQILTLKYPDKLSAMYDWLVENAEEKKIKFVFGLGDITDKCTDTEWQAAKREINKLNGVIPYSLVRGNHDRYYDSFNGYFPYSEYGKNVSGSYDGSMLNTYQLLTVGKIKYLIVNLDFGPTDEVLEWANGVVSQHPDHNVIVTTHIYLHADGTTIDEGEGSNAIKYGGVNTGERMFEKFISKHKNIVLVLSGHSPSERIVVTRATGDGGNEIVQMLVDPQGSDKNLGGVGLVAMLYFSEDGKEVDVEYYSTDRKAFYLADNQFHLELNVIEASVPATNPENGSEEPNSFAFLWVVVPLSLLALSAGVVLVIKKKK